MPGSRECRAGLSSVNGPKCSALNIIYCLSISFEQTPDLNKTGPNLSFTLRGNPLPLQPKFLRLKTPIWRLLQERISVCSTTN
jgi:hypothetical protein